MGTTIAEERYLHENHRGDVVGVTDIGGNVVYRFEYSTYGEIFEVNSANELDEFTDFEEIVYGFQGRRLDSETNGLMYFRNRYYNAKLGRFIQRDSLGYIDSYGLYEAFGNNSYEYTDPFGLRDAATAQKIARAAQQAVQKAPPPLKTAAVVIAVVATTVAYFSSEPEREPLKITNNSKPLAVSGDPFKNRPYRRPVQENEKIKKGLFRVRITSSGIQPSNLKPGKMPSAPTGHVSVGGVTSKPEHLYTHTLTKDKMVKVIPRLNFDSPGRSTSIFEKAIDDNIAKAIINYQISRLKDPAVPLSLDANCFAYAKEVFRVAQDPIPDSVISVAGLMQYLRARKDWKEKIP